MPSDYSSPTAAAPPSPTSRPPMSPSPPLPWTDDDDNDAATDAAHNSTAPSRFSINRAGTSRSSMPRAGSLRRSAGGSIRSSRQPRGFRGLVATVYATANALARWLQGSANHALAFFLHLSPLYRVFFLLGAAAGLALTVLMLVYSHKLLGALGPIARGVRDLPGGWVLVWLSVFITGFPPLIGYSTACTAAGVVYGFPWGWPLVATANVAGSLAAFVACRGVLSGYVDRLVGKDHRFQALGHVLRHDGLWVLAAVRFCPLPYSLSNGFLATVPSITPWAFAVSTAMASPKLLVHVFVGSRLALLAEDGDSMSAADKAVNYLSMFGFGLIGLGVGVLVFRRTMARAAVLQREEAAEEGRAGAGGRRPSAAGGEDGPVSPFADSDNLEPLLDPDDADVAALMDDDDISLWTTDHFADGDGDGDGDADGADNADGSHTNKAYHDESDDGDANSGRRKR